MSKYINIIDEKKLINKKHYLADWQYNFLKFFLIWGMISIVIVPIILFLLIKSNVELRKENSAYKSKIAEVDSMRNNVIKMQEELKKIKYLIGNGDSSLLKDNQKIEILAFNEHDYLKDNLNDNKKKIFNINKERNFFLNNNDKNLENMDYSLPNFIWPVKGVVTALFSGEDNVIYHTGIDISASYSTPVLCAFDGIVEKVDWNDIYGNYIIISHNSNVKTLYAHLSRIIVTENQKIEKGKTIGFVGSTGKSTAPHLHFEIKVKNISVDPMLYLL